MYKVTIQTKYNTIVLVVDDINTPEMQELYNQPYVTEVYIETMHHYTEEERNELLNHVVGTTFRTNKALEMTKELRKENDK